MHACVSDGRSAYDLRLISRAAHVLRLIPRAAHVLRKVSALGQAQPDGSATG